jgi:hypothetical protein
MAMKDAHPTVKAGNKMCQAIIQVNWSRDRNTESNSIVYLLQEWLRAEFQPLPCRNGCRSAWTGLLHLEPSCAFSDSIGAGVSSCTVRRQRPR